MVARSPGASAPLARGSILHLPGPRRRWRRDLVLHPPGLRPRLAPGADGGDRGTDCGPDPGSLWTSFSGRIGPRGARDRWGAAGGGVVSEISGGAGAGLDDRRGAAGVWEVMGRERGAKT